MYLRCLLSIAAGEIRIPSSHDGNESEDKCVKDRAERRAGLGEGSD